jgi:hypothetical protein
MTIFQLDDCTSVGDAIGGITFQCVPTPAADFGVSRLHDQIDHVEVVEPLDEQLWDDEQHTSWTARVGACEARVEARRRMLDARLGPVQVEDRARVLGFPATGGSDQPSGTYRTEVFDAVVDELETLAMLDVLDQERELCHFDVDEYEEFDDDDEHRVSDEEAHRRWKIRRRQLLAPVPLIERRRRYHLPPPLDQWDRRNAVQQWYFAATDRRVDYWQGGSASSGQRETHGRMAHAFATLSQSTTIRTVVIQYDAHNIARLRVDSPTLLVDHADLVGNYAIDYEASEELIAPFTVNARSL